MKKQQIFFAGGRKNAEKKLKNLSNHPKKA